MTHGVAPGFDPDKPSTWPALMSAREVALVRRMSHKSVLNAYAAGKMLPAPRRNDHYHPRWHRDDVRAWIEGRRY